MLTGKGGTEKFFTYKQGDEKDSKKDNLHLLETSLLIGSQTSNQEQLVRDTLQNFDERLDAEELLSDVVTNFLMSIC